MASPTYFVQECCTCGRNLQVRIEYLGRKVACQHCGAKFVACDPQNGSTVSSDSGSGLLARVDELIRQSGVHLAESRRVTTTSEVV